MSLYLTTAEKSVLRCLLDLEDDCQKCAFDDKKQDVCGLYESWDDHKRNLLKKLTENGLI